MPNSNKLANLADVLGVSTAHLLGLDAEGMLKSVVSEMAGENEYMVNLRLSQKQAGNAHEKFLFEKSRADLLEKENAALKKRLENVHKGLVKLVEQIGREE